MKKCTRCLIEKSLDDFYNHKASSDGKMSWCKTCRRETRGKENARRRELYANDMEWRDKKRASDRQAYQRRKTEAQEHQRSKYRSMKETIFERYGGKCECCGETRKEFFAIDHVFGGGTRARREQRHNQSLYLMLSKCEERLKEYRILCHNCNMSKGFYGYCPHDIDKSNIVS